MKKIIVIATLALICFSCKNEEEKAIDYVIISGDISNSNGGSLDIRSSKGFSETINIKDTGSFTDTLYVDNGPYLIRTSKGYVPVYLTKGSKIHFITDDKQFVNSLTFSGNHTSFNNYYAYKAKKDNDFQVSARDAYVLSEDEFEKTVKDFQNDLEQKLATVDSIPEAIIAKEKRSINYGRLNKKIMYKRAHGRDVNLPDFKVSDAFDKELTEMTFNNAEDYFFSSDYKQMVNTDIMVKAIEMYQKDSIPYQEAQEKTIASIENEAIRNAELYSNAAIGLPRFSNLKEAVDKFMNASTDDSHKQKINELYASLKMLESGQPSPKFVNYINFAGGSTSLDDLKGRYVYIDIWATWCGPCKYEIPFLQKVEKQYHGKNIEFVSISVDKQEDKTKWETMVKEKEMGGVQLFANSDFKSKFVRDYKVTGIPKFILLDPEGNIVRANAPRPSDKKLINLFNELNI